MRVVMLLVLLASLASCASANRNPSSETGGPPQAIEDGSFPGRSN